jgi:hypothetical protein
VSPDGQRILEYLADVERLRVERAGSPALTTAVHLVKQYQSARFSRTYADLLADTRYAQAARFFLNELYGPQEFAARDAQFARIVPALVRIFPVEIVGTVRTLAQLHALSESLDSRMGRHWLAAATGVPAMTAGDYIAAWRATGEREGRAQQIDLTMQIGRALDHYTRKPLLRGALHMMRRPAQAAGLGELQHFLECGFDTFGQMRGAGEFLDIVRQREAALAEALFGAESVTSATSSSGGTPRPTVDTLGQLP